jgi:D-glycero-alpha-D-manno-heptose-7-phosphate kinase
MIISRTPLRITIGGGGTDLPSFYSKHGGFVISLSINKYIYITLKPDDFEKNLKLRYSQIEVVDDVSEIQNHRAKELLNLHNIKNSCEINTCADLPSNTGLGSSGTFLVGLSNVIREFKRLNREPKVLADDACHVEIDILNEPVGKQDQYIAAFGGLKILDIDTDGKVSVKEVDIEESHLKLFLSHIHLYYTNVKRDASDVLQDQKQLKGNSEETLKKVKEQAYKTLDLLEKGDFIEYGKMLDDYWKLKKSLSNKISISEIDTIYDHVKDNFGVLGGKIVGAGGGGFLLLFTNQKHFELENFMTEKGYKRLHFDVDKLGSTILGNFT